MHSKTQKQGELQHRLHFSDLIDLFAMIEKQLKCRLKKEIFIFVKSVVLTKNWFVVSNFSEFRMHHTEECPGDLYFILKTKVKFATFRTF